MTRAERQHKTRLSELGCMACRRIHGPHAPGPVELHHYRAQGWGKGDYTTLIPLCHLHHQGKDGIHTLGTKAFDRINMLEHGFTQRDLLQDALELLEVTA